MDLYKLREELNKLYDNTKEYYSAFGEYSRTGKPEYKDVMKILDGHGEPYWNLVNMGIDRGDLQTFLVDKMSNFFDKTNPTDDSDDGIAENTDVDIESDKDKNDKNNGDNDKNLDDGFEI